MYSQIIYQKEFVNDLKEKVTEKVKNVDKEFYQSWRDVSGFARFQNDSLHSIYINLSRNTNSVFKSVLKYIVMDNEFVFTNVYLKPKSTVWIGDDTLDDRNNIEYRYDSDMNLDAKYVFNEEFLNNNNVLATKVEDTNGKTNIQYYFPEESRNFTKYLNILEDKNIIINLNESNIISGIANGYFVKDLDENNKVFYININSKKFLRKKELM